MSSSEKRSHIYFVHANPAAMESIAAFLAGQGEVGGRETTSLPYDGRHYPCFQIDGEDVSRMKQMAADKPDVFTSIRLFTRPDGPGKTARDVTFMVRKSKAVRRAVLSAMAGHTPPNGSAIRGTHLVRRAK